MSRRYSSRTVVEHEKDLEQRVPWWYAEFMPSPWEDYLWVNWMSAFAEVTLGVCDNVWRKQGARLYGVHRDQALREDLQDWLWVKAVEAGAWFIPDPGHPNPHLQWAAWLYRNLSEKSRYHFGEQVGDARIPSGEAAIVAYRTNTSTDLLDDLQLETGRVVDRHALHGQPFGYGDPAGVVLRAEAFLADAARLQASGATTGAYSTTSWAGSTCLINLCTRDAKIRGYCESHYRQVRKDEVDTGIWEPHTRGTCSVDGCDEPHSAKGYCKLHYDRWQRTGSTELAGPRTCSVEGCDRPHQGRDLCGGHLQRLRTTGEINPDKPLRARQVGDCDIEGCDQPKATKGMCKKHYRAQREKDAPPCNVEGCAKQSATRGMCPMHYQRWRKNRAAQKGVGGHE